MPAAAIAWGFALYVWLIAPRTLASRLLVAMLVIDGIAVISSYENGAVYLDRVIGIGLLGWWRIHQASDWAVMAVYLAFIGVTVSSPLTRPFGGRRARIALLTIGRTPEYETYRKLQVYEAALRAALEGGVVQAGQRPLLEALVTSLGIDPAAVRRLEQDLTAGTARPA